MNTTRRAAGFLSFPLVALLAVACSSSGSASQSPSASAPPPSASSAPSGAVVPDPDAPVSTNSPPGDGGADAGGRLVEPRPGQQDVRPIPATSLTAVVDGRRVVVTVHFTSGVEPCYVLDSVLVAKEPGAFAITLREGTGPGDVVCIQIAELKRVQVDLGALEPGAYTITDATGGAAAIQVVVS